MKVYTWSLCQLYEITTAESLLTFLPKLRFQMPDKVQTEDVKTKQHDHCEEERKGQRDGGIVVCYINHSEQTTHGLPLVSLDHA